MSSLLIAKNSNESKKYSRDAKRGIARRIYKGIYTTDLITPLPELTVKFWLSIITYLVPDGILAFRSALELKPIRSKDNDNFQIFMLAKNARLIKLPGLVIKIQAGNYTEFVETVIPSLSRSNEARSLLENLTLARKILGISKTMARIDLEEYLAKQINIKGDNAINDLRDQAKKISIALGLTAEYQELSTLISSLLNTHNLSNKKLQSEYAISLQNKQPYDQARVQLFENLAIYLQKSSIARRSYQFKQASWRNLTFFEAYFSNYIEGTEFLIEEAEEIVFKNQLIAKRHQDSHDVKSLFQVASNLQEMQKIPTSAKEFLKLLRTRHYKILWQRADKNPGEWKTQINKAGNTVFVEPQNVTGTLIKAFDIYQVLQDPLARAIYLMFVVSEIHPFNDGNGRLARLMMNAELVATGNIKIMIPTVERENYLSGLKIASREGNFNPFCRILDQCQAYTAMHDWTDYQQARSSLEKTSGHLPADEGLPFFYKSIRDLLVSDF